MARHPADRPRAPTLRSVALAVSLATALGVAPDRASAQAAPAVEDPAPRPPDVPAPPPPAPGAAAVQRVEISGSADANAERRRSTAAKIVYGRDELDRMGDSTLGEVLKRLPGVTMGGPPGRGGNPSLRGMGSGYTAILIDGQRMPFGFSLDSIAPEQIERIEIMRSPVAEHSARAVAGIINVIMREDFKRKTNELRMGGGVEDGDRPQGGINWTYSGQTEALGYNLSAALNRQTQGDASTSIDRATDADGRTTLLQHFDTESTTRRSHLFGSARLQFRLGPGHTLDLQPMVSLNRNHQVGRTRLNQEVGVDPAPFGLAQTDSEGDSSMARLNGSWMRTLDDGDRLQGRFSGVLYRIDTLAHRDETGGPTTRLKVDDSGVRDASVDVNGKYSRLIADRHSVSTGLELQASRRTDRRVTTENEQLVDTGFGDTLQARTLRLAVWAQDEWEWSKTFSFYAGLRWEGIETRSDSAELDASNRSSVLTPLAHMVWKLPDAPRDQVRLSLTRSYKAPTTSQLIARPALSNQFPHRNQENKPLSPDRAGNPALKPELAWGLDLAYEHYLDAGGIVSANLFGRRIENLIRNVLAQEAVVPWADVPRFVSRPQNIGGAVAAGLEMEARFRAADLWATELPLAVRANGSLLWSRVDGVAGPDNRLDQQPRYTANLGVDWPLRGLPLTLGASLNFTPSFVVQQIDAQVYRQGAKRALDAYASWRLGTTASVRLSVANASASDYDTGTTVLLGDGSAQSSDSRARTFTVVTLRAELRF